MTIDDAKKVKDLLEIISVIKDIKKAMEKEKTHWWAFATPDTCRNDYGLRMPDILRDKFKGIVDECWEELNKQLEEL